jgi:hypothetical protein
MDDGDPRRPCLRPRGTHPAVPAWWGRQPWGRRGALPHGARHAGHRMEDREEKERWGKG